MGKRGRKRPARVTPTLVPPREEKARCSSCRIHAARLDGLARARYVPELGIRFRVRAQSGGTVSICPRCTPIAWKQEDGPPKMATLVEMGIVTQRQASQIEPLNV